MFTGIIQGIASVRAVVDRPGLRSFSFGFAPGFCDGLVIGASVAVDGVCLTVTARHGDDAADFDVMQQSLALTTLAALQPGGRINVERAARDGAEIGGHPLSGHVDFMGTVTEVHRPHGLRPCGLTTSGALRASHGAAAPAGAGWRPGPLRAAPPRADHAVPPGSAARRDLHRAGRRRCRRRPAAIRQR